LALLEDVVVIHPRNGKRQACLVLRGLDLVDGTPVFDVKPFVPWDCIDDSLRMSATTDTAMKLMIYIRK
jgi:tRNA (Thr-GGU) A37 N-methylase